MENTHEINKKIAQNLTYYRKASGMTQAELAQKINYSDKSVSKWESGGGVPDIYILMQLADLYGVSIDALVGKAPIQAPQNMAASKKKKGSRLLLILLSSGLVWLVATCCFVGVSMWNDTAPAWLAFMYAVVVNAIVLIVYSGIWKYRFVNFLSVSLLVWTTILSIYLTVDYILLQMNMEIRALWVIFLLGIPLQVLETLWVFFRSLFVKKKKKDAE